MHSRYIIRGGDLRLYLDIPPSCCRCVHSKCQSVCSYRSPLTFSRRRRFLVSYEPTPWSLQERWKPPDVDGHEPPFSNSWALILCHRAKLHLYLVAPSQRRRYMSPTHETLLRKSLSNSNSSDWLARRLSPFTMTRCHHGCEIQP